ncbi:hypothetical protein B0H11DRAFT_2294990 [Mycena galericulata]|nr:hypothetical protein B0H11DRAFT_2294990 [Mycena galericulata]
MVTVTIFFCFPPPPPHVDDSVLCGLFWRVNVEREGSDGGEHGSGAFDLMSQTEPIVATSDSIGHSRQRFRLEGGKKIANATSESNVEQVPRHSSERVAAPSHSTEEPPIDHDDTAPSPAKRKSVLTAAAPAPKPKRRKTGDSLAGRPIELVPGDKMTAVSPREAPQFGRKLVIKCLELSRGTIGGDDVGLLQKHLRHFLESLKEIRSVRWTLLDTDVAWAHDTVVDALNNFRHLEELHLLDWSLDEDAIFIPCTLGPLSNLRNFRFETILSSRFKAWTRQVIERSPDIAEL